MAFTDSDILKIAAATLAAGVVDSSGSQWYEKRAAWGNIIDPSNVWSDMALLKTLPCSNYTGLLENVNNNPELMEFVGIDEDGTYNDETAIKLTPVTGTNFTSYLAYNTFGDLSSGTQTNWIQPQLIPQASGAASSQYQARIFSGPPSQGNLIYSSAGFDGDWVSHFWSPSLGMLMISPDDAPPSSTFPSQDLYVCGVIYKGNTGGSGSSGGDTVPLESDSGDYWRLKISDDGKDLTFDRYEQDSEDNYSWVTRTNMEGNTYSSGIVLDKHNALAFDKNNITEDYDSNKLEYVYGVRMEPETEDVILSGYNTTTKIETDTDIYRDNTILVDNVYDSYPLEDFTIQLDDDNLSCGWVSDLDISSGEIPYVRLTSISLKVASVSSEGEVPVRFALYSYPEKELILENVSEGGLYAGDRGCSYLQEGENWYNFSPYYIGEQGVDVYVEVTIRRGDSVELLAGDYTFLDIADNESRVQTIPKLSIKCSQLKYEVVLDNSNFKEEAAANTNTYISNGVSSYIDNGTDGIEGPWNLAGTAQHVDTRNAVLGNFYDKTYINAGNGGLWSLVENSSSTTDLWSNLDRVNTTDQEAPTDYLETTKLSISLYGLFDTELADLEVTVINLYGMKPLIAYKDAEESVDTSNRYRVHISPTSAPDVILYESQTYFSFLNGEDCYGEWDFKLSGEVAEDYLYIQVPNRSFTMGTTTSRTVNIQFEKPVKVYGYYDDPLNPTEDTFTPSLKGECILCTEEEILYGEGLENKIDSVVGATEWTEAEEKAYSTLHEDSSLEWLADFNEEPIFFFNTESDYTNQDIHQSIYTTGREACFSSTTSTGVTNEYIVHIPYAENVNCFYVSLLTEDLDAKVGTVLYTFYIDTLDVANNIKIEASVNNGSSLFYTFTKDRSGNYRYRSELYTETDSASYNINNVASSEIPTN